LSVDLLAVSGLFAGHDGVAVVHDLNLMVAEGEIVALLGPNGAGKSTTLLTIAGALPMLGGDIRLLGTSVRGRPVHQLARDGLALVPEDRGLFPQLSVAENLRIGARQHSRIGVDDVLTYFPALGPLLGRRCGLLSGGEQQMLGIARALVAQPRLLMIDEMGLGLAPVVMADLATAIRRVARDHDMGLLIVEQHVHVALSLADRAYVLSNGRLVMQGPAERVRAHPEVLEASYLGGAVAPEEVEDRGPP
jgi:branched-chain amino acid transport system ATP-binding protein